MTPGRIARACWSLNFVREPSNCLEGVSINVRMLPGSEAIANGMARTVLDRLCTQLIPVWFSDGSRKMLMHPDEEVAALVVSGDRAPVHLEDEVTAWRERYAMFSKEG